MALKMTGKQKRELRDALVAAFPSWMELQKMLADQLDWRLAVISSPAQGLDSNAFELLQWAEARGYLGELVVAARNENPGNPELQRCSGSLGLSSAFAIGPDSLEKLVGSNTTFLDVARWRAELTRAEWRVCRVDCDGIGIGTGVLVGPSLVLTNYHVAERLVANQAEAPRWSCRFDHKLSEAGDVIAAGRVIRLATAWYVDHAPYSQIDLQGDPKPGDPAPDELDFLLLRVAEPIGEQPVGKGAMADCRGWIELSPRPVELARQRVVAILQHPSARPMKLALGMEQRLTVNRAANRIRYTVPTEPGSSGAPVFDGDFRLIALHHAGDPRTAHPEYNEGIPVEWIAARPRVAAALPR
jgi:hypothetical protein